MSIVRITDLFKEYGKGDASVKAVNHVSLAIEKGEFLTIVGTSGSGKTTLLNLMGGLDYPDGGKVVIEGQDITGMKSDDLTIFRRKKIGFIFQNLDTKTSREVLGLLSASCKKFDQTLVMITHNDEIAKLADRSLRIEDGLIKSERQGMS